MTEPKNQHIVPRVYLKQFARDGLVAYDKARDINEQVTNPTLGDVEELAAKMHFYTLFREDGPDYSMEQTLNRVENHYKALQKPLRSREPLSEDQIPHFVAAGRNPRSMIGGESPRLRRAYAEGPRRDRIVTPRARSKPI
jgi:hypothetical protein